MKAYLTDEASSQMYLSIELACEMFDLTSRQVKALIKNNNMKGSDRFRRVDDIWYISVDFKRPLARQVERSYYRALTISKTESRLAKALSVYVGGSRQDYDRIYRYLHRFTFKHYVKAKMMNSLLTRYIREHRQEAYEDE